MIISAEISDSKKLTEIALKSKAFWGYSNELIESWREDLTINSKMISDCSVYKFLVDETIAGFYVLNPPKGNAIELEMLFVLPEFIGKKIGKQLLHHSFEKAKEVKSRSMILLADPNAPLAVPAKGVNKTFERGKAAIAEASATLLAERAEAEPSVRAATEEAEEKQSKAELPGADQKAKLDALVAAREAARLLAEKAVEHFAGPPPAQWGGLVNGLPPAAPAATDPMPANPEQQFQEALIAGQAASSANTAAMAAAQKVWTSSKVFSKELKAIKHPTIAETDALNAVTIVMTAGEAAIDAFVTKQDFVGEALREVRDRVKKYTIWANQRHASTPGQLALQATAGFATSAFEDTKVAAVSEADLIRVSAGLVKDPYAGPAMPAAVGVPGGLVDMGHITERHVAETYLFDNESCPEGSKHDAGMLLGGALAGVSKSAAQNNLISEGNRNKPNSFFSRRYRCA